MNIALLGCGYVGTELAKQALLRGMQVAALTRNTERAAALRKLGVERVVESELDSTDWHAAIDPNQDLVINTVSSAGGGLEGYKKSYMHGQQSIAQWASLQEPKSSNTFIYTSATSVYPQSTGEWVDETNSTDGCSPYANVLLEAEQVALDCPAFNQKYVLRLAGIYGPGRHFMLNQLLEGKLTYPGVGSNYLNLIHLEDICAAIWHLHDNKKVQSGIYNVADGSAATKADILNWMAKKLELAATPQFDPTTPLKREGSRRGATGKLPNRRVSNAKLKAVGWALKYPTFREGFAEIIASQS